MLGSVSPESAEDHPRMLCPTEDMQVDLLPHLNMENMSHSSKGVNLVSWSIKPQDKP